MNELNKLAKLYLDKSSPTFKELALIYKKYETSLLDTLASSVAIYGIFQSDRLDMDKITPQMEEAFKLSFPDLDFNELSSYSVEQFNGIINNWKGKYFEVLVRDKLNNGELIGDLHLENGEYAQLAESPTQAGWDIQIFDAEGIPLETLQLKATNSLNYINETLEKYPQFEIISTSEVAENHIELINSGIENEEITGQVVDFLEPINDSLLVDAMESVLPFSGLIIIGTIQGRRYITGKVTMQDAAISFAEKAVKSGITLGAGALAFMAFDSGLISIPVSLLTSLFLNRNKYDEKILERLSANKANLFQYKEVYG